MSSPSEISKRSDISHREDLVQESELVVAIIRTALIIIAMVAPWKVEASEGTQHAMTVIIVSAAIYNVAVFVALVMNLRLPLRRVTMLAMDVVFVASWVVLTWQPGLGPGEAYSPLFPYIYIVVCIGALWYRVTGALLTAVVLSIIYLLAIHIRTDDPVTVVDALFRDVVYVFLLAITAGYMADVLLRRQTQYIAAQKLLQQYQERFRVAQEAYETLLPMEPPVIPNLEIATRWEVAFREGGGDFYDVIRLDHQRTLFVIADVSGKATRGARKLPLFKLTIQSVAQEEKDPGRILTRVNRNVFASLQPDMFIGACLIVIDTSTGTMTYANAGQDPPILVRRHSLDTVQLRTGGLVLGVTDDQEYQSKRLTLESGDVLCLYTDGFTEARNPEGREYGYPDLEGRIRAAVGIGLTAQAAADNLYQAVRDHVQDVTLHDDRALVIVRYLPNTASL
jgi:serine phosphatase RsbU (regulator of sigma subunit)